MMLGSAGPGEGIDRLLIGHQSIGVSPQATLDVANIGQGHSNVTRTSLDELEPVLLVLLMMFLVLCVFGVFVTISIVNRSFCRRSLVAALSE